MSFTGTQDKCKTCDKTVHFIDLLTADGVSYHKTCFKCSHCKGTLSMCNYSSMDGVLYCKTHFEQLFKETGNFSKNFTPGGKSAEKSEAKAPSKMSSAFSGTQDKCAACQKTVYPLEKRKGMKAQLQINEAINRLGYNGAELQRQRLDQKLKNTCQIHYDPEQQRTEHQEKLRSSRRRS
ncbi:unnamed protein product [Triticum turgidum subsp. durum]|uniref:LIM zinc-binding domain-containing protein n=1 Tax=Triticum turgidum subsp. durum TaxID=4567 RepID=A0A9R0Y2V1_TRITD|nr:unnamed protein product [Triticum turgidum subsp. durum]